MEFSIKVSLILLVTSYSAFAQPYPPQLNVLPLLICNCQGYDEISDKCSWTGEKKKCDTSSDYYKNFQINCEFINDFRNNKSEGATKADFVMRLPCQSYLPQKEMMATGVDPTLQKYTARALTNNTRYSSTLPVPTTRFDHRGSLNSIKDQGQCGSCWAFPTCALCEWYYSYVKKVSLSLSEQCLVDCERIDSGCNGGWPPNALEYATNSGLVTTAALPYTSGTTGRRARKCPVASTTQRYKCPAASEEYYSAGNCERLKALVAKGPVYVGFFVADDFYYIKSGIYKPTTATTCTPGGINHAIMVVGYFPDYIPPGGGAAGPVFIIRNSWGTGWAENGYAYIDASVNTCSLCTYMWYYMV